MTQGSPWHAWIAMAVIVAYTVACTAATTQSTPAPSPTAQVEEFTEETLTRYQGKVVMLNFWATWCLPCRAEMPDMEAVYRTYRDQGVVIVAVNVAESSGIIIAFADRLDLTFPLLRDSQRKALSAYGIDVLPTTLFVSREGQVVAREEGSLDQDEMSARIEELLK